MSKQAFDWSKCMSYDASSDVGMRRSNNQDSCAVALAKSEDEWYDRGHLFVVADGMGAHAAGELASKLAVDHVVHIYRKSDQLSPPEALEKAIREANDEIHRRGEANLDFHNMGTTCSALLLLPQGVVAGHVGDSRVYRFRGTKLEQLTFDHSLVWEMREAGQIKNEKEESQVPKNVITRSLGPQPTVKVDLEGPFPTVVGDTFLLCSDGLTGRVEDAEIGAALDLLPVDRANQFLINLANLRGGPDNITIVSISVDKDTIATETAAAAPLTMGGRSGTKPPLHPGWWIALGVSGLLTAALGIANGWGWAAIPASAFVLLAIVIVIQKSDLFSSEGVRLGGRRRLGKGPHRSYLMTPGGQFCRALLDDLSAGKKSAESRNWPFAWSEFDGHLESAHQHIAAGKNKNAGNSLLDASSILADLFQTYARADK